MVRYPKKWHRKRCLSWSQRLAAMALQPLVRWISTASFRHAPYTYDVYRQWRILPGAGGHAPRWRRDILLASILILLLSRLHTMGRGNTKVAVCRRLLLSNRLVFAAFCCLCAVHCTQAAAASFVSPKAVFLACKIGTSIAELQKIALRMH